ncbi:MAG: hypothetical protein WAM69_07105 [Candidatus Sulfotelmatobacter sp.]
MTRKSARYLGCLLRRRLGWFVAGFVVDAGMRRVNIRGNVQ